MKFYHKRTLRFIPSNDQSKNKRTKENKSTRVKIQNYKLFGTHAKIPMTPTRVTVFVKSPRNQRDNVHLWHRIPYPHKVLFRIQTPRPRNQSFRSAYLLQSYRSRLMTIAHPLEINPFEMHPLENTCIRKHMHSKYIHLNEGYTQQEELPPLQSLFAGTLARACAFVTHYIARADLLVWLRTLNQGPLRSSRRTVRAWLGAGRRWNARNSRVSSPPSRCASRSHTHASRRSKLPTCPPTPPKDTQLRSAACLLHTHEPWGESCGGSSAKRVAPKRLSPSRLGACMRRHWYGVGRSMVCRSRGKMILEPARLLVVDAARCAATRFQERTR